jgi:hypothetical protein
VTPAGKGPGNEVSLVVVLMEDPFPTMNLRAEIEMALGSLQENEYDFQLEEDIECEKMSGIIHAVSYIQHRKYLCSLIPETIIR